MRGQHLEMYTVYDHPKDYPEAFVVRRFRITKDGPLPDDRFLFISIDLDTCRELMMMMQLTRVMRDADDDPVILETWL